MLYLGQFPDASFCFRCHQRQGGGAAVPIISLPVSPEGNASDGVLRKLAHGTEFCILGIELAALLHQAWKQHWERLILCGVGTALLDETIQLFVAGRSGMIKDVWIDLGGYTVGAAICLLLCTRLHGTHPRVR